MDNNEHFIRKAASTAEQYIDLIREGANADAVLADATSTISNLAEQMNIPEELRSAFMLSVQREVNRRATRGL